MFIVPNRTRVELMAKIEQYIAPDTTIMSDDWESYRRINESANNYTHLTVNHTENYVDPVTGAHTQTIEGFWGNAKAVIKSMHGVHPQMRSSHLDDIVWRWNHRDVDTMDVLIGLMSRYYNVDDDDVPLAFLGQKPPVQY